MSFKSGDIVTINGQDHQKMTVINQTVFGDRYTNWYKCVWITKEGKLQQSEFPVTVMVGYKG